MNIGEVARHTGVPAKTIRYYEDIGLLPRATRAANGYRHYRDSDLRTLQFIQRARGLGFPIKDVANLLALWSRDDRASADVKALALKHIEAINGRIDELRSMRDTLVHLTERCHGDDRPDCPILADLAGQKG
ncbi:MAG: Cu(I)-responsive transcriptional regulator [Rhodobacterales bacterium]|nr:Cu(I)-responsive transcriptional regulator [Rhodobacterales bacterium]